MRKSSSTRRILLSFLIAFAVAGFIATWWTRGVMSHLPFLPGHGKTMFTQRDSGRIVDLTAWQTIQALAPLAVTVEEQAYARQAEALADHEIDLAFSLALRKAANQRVTLTGKAKELSSKVDHYQQIVQEDQAAVDRLTQEAKRAENARAAAHASPGEPGASDLDIAKAQLALDTDQLTEAKRNLARITGDERVRIQQELTAHEAALQKDKHEEPGARSAAIIAAGHYGTLYGQVRAWINQINRNRLIDDARKAALSDAARLKSEHDTLDAQVSQPSATGSTGENRAERLAAFKLREEQNKMLAIYDDRLQTQQQLAEVYADWSRQILRQHNILLHMVLLSLTIIACVLIGLMLVEWLIGRVLDRLHLDLRRARTLRTILKVGLQILGVLIVLMLVFGAPRQTPTILGVVTAGLVVALQDYILAFMGWFALVGRNGIHPGDWVEINDVVGEVLEIGLFRTVVLESGNWTDAGHPTGRRIAFINSFAIRGQYFNFSTEGQWMWDELSITAPAGDRLYGSVDAIEQAVIAETTRAAALAEQEWQYAARQTDMRRFTVQPSISLRPRGSDVEILIRYVTRAPERYEMRTLLYRQVMEILSGTIGDPAPAGPAEADLLQK